MARKFSERQMSMILSAVAYPVSGYPALCCNPYDRDTVTVSKRLDPLLCVAAYECGGCANTENELGYSYIDDYVTSVFNRLQKDIENV